MTVDTLPSVQIDGCRDQGIWLGTGHVEASLNNLRVDLLHRVTVATGLWRAC